jgi:hypothetical protein
MSEKLELLESWNVRMVGMSEGWKVGMGGESESRKVGMAGKPEWLESRNGWKVGMAGKSESQNGWKVGRLEWLEYWKFGIDGMSEGRKVGMGGMLDCWTVGRADSQRVGQSES